MNRFPQFLYYFLAACVADAICGGMVSALLQTRSPYWQAMNDAYQFTFFVIAFAFGLNVKYIRGMICYCIMFVGMVHDTVFYALHALPVFNWVILLLTGTTYHAPKGVFPDAIGGWPAWILRKVGVEFAFPMLSVLAINAVAIFVVVKIQLNRRSHD